MTIGALITFNSLLAYFLDPVKNLVDLQPQMQTCLLYTSLFVKRYERLKIIFKLHIAITEKQCYNSYIPKTVSYTHLDVYKRQVKLFLPVSTTA